MTLVCAVLLIFSGVPPNPGQSDLRVSEAFFCDPGCGDVASALVENLGPDVATRVIVRFTISEGAALAELDIDTPCTIISPGTGRSGDVSVEVATLGVGQSFSIKAQCYTDAEEGWSRTVSFAAVADQVDPSPDDGVHNSVLSVPFRPRVDSVRELSSPFRLELTGSYLSLRPFGAVWVGSCDSVFPQFEESSDGTKLVLLGGKELRKLFPKGTTVVIQIVNIQGGYSATPYTRPAPSN